MCSSRWGQIPTPSRTDDMTCYHMTIPATALATAVEIEADRFQNLKYDEPSFQKEARAVLGEYNKSASSPFLKLNETMQDTAYTTHTYKHTTIGFLDDIATCPTSMRTARSFSTAGIARRIARSSWSAMSRTTPWWRSSKQYYGGWKRGKSQVEIPTEPPQSKPKSARLTWPLPTLPILTLGYHIPAADPAHPDTAASGCTRGSGLRRGQSSLPRAGLEGTKGRHDHGRGRIEARPRPLFHLCPGTEVGGSADRAGTDRRRPGRGGQNPDRLGAARCDQVSSPLPHSPAR